ncbi:unnamed protein product [Durusdinium trenchii]|uniref:EF-hand domain-containing protein n=1 Tax=Durusdinium trenchii TaxID=1381693 RepID=A0ABP0J126_9DINO
MASQRAANRLERGPQITDRIDSTAIKSRDVQLTRDGRSARSLWSPQLQVRQLQERKDEEKAERLRSEPLRLKVTQSLSEIFLAASKDGVMEKQDFEEVMSSPYFLRKLQSVANMPVQDMLRMFDWLDVNQQGSINQEDFMAGFDWLNEAVTGKSLLKLQTSARHRCRKIESRASALRSEINSAEAMLTRRSQDMDQVLQEVLQRIEAETEQQSRARERVQMQLMELRVQIEHYRAQVSGLSAGGTGSKLALADSRREDARPKSPHRTGLVSQIKSAASKLSLGWRSGSSSGWRSSSSSPRSAKTESRRR